MKKSTLITLGIVMSTMLVTGCEEKKRCVDADGKVVEDEKCRRQEQTGTHGGLYMPMYRWYYGGEGFDLGSRAAKGSYQPVSRGGFGRLAFWHGSSAG